MTALRQLLEDVVYAPLVFGVGLAVLVFEIVVLVMAARRQRRGGARLPLELHAIAGAAIAALPILLWVSVRAARARMIAVFLGETTDLSEKVSAMSRGTAAQLSAMPPAVAITMVTVTVWGAGLAFTLSAPPAGGRARSFPLLLLILGGLVPTALGALQWSAGVIKAFGALAGVDPSEKTALLAQALVRARAELTGYAWISTIAISLLAAAAVVVIVMRARQIASDVPPPAPSARVVLAGSAAAVLLAVLLAVQARPMAAENAMPWPAKMSEQLVIPRMPPTPDLAGPDEIERAPVVIVHRDWLGLDGTDGEDFASLESKLTTLRNNYRLLYPGGHFNETAVLLADRATPIPRFTSVLQAIRGADYRKPLLTFAKAESIVRPVLGRAQRINATCARVRLVYVDGKDDDEYDDAEDAAPWKHAAVLRPSDFPAYEALARRIVELRRAGKPVIVNVDRPPP